MHLFTVVILLLTLLSACGGGGSMNGGTSPPQNTSEETIFSELAPEDVTVIANRISWGSGDQQFGILYRPDHLTNPLPVVVMVHGGCWFSPYTLELQSDLSEALARRGYAVWNIEFRRLGNGGDWPVIFLDVAEAADFLLGIGDQYNLDLERVSAIGHSSGGHLALWLAARPRVRSDSVIYSPNPIPIRGVVGLGPITDLQSSICANSVPRLIAQNTLSSAALSIRLAATSPRSMLPMGVATILVSGSNDSIAPPDITQDYVDAAIKSGDLSEHLILEGADHFDLLDSNYMDMNLMVNNLLLVERRTPAR